MYSSRLAIWLIVLSLFTHAPALFPNAAAGDDADAAVPAWQAKEERREPMVYVAAVLTNVVYTPVKVIYAGLGAVASGVTYVVTLGNSDATRSIWNTTVNGDYIVTPPMIEGNKPVHFSGE